MVQNPGTPALSHQNSQDFWIFISRTAGMMKWQGVNTSEPQNFRSFPSITTSPGSRHFWYEEISRAPGIWGFLGNIDEYWIEDMKKNPTLKIFKAINPRRNVVTSWAPTHLLGEAHLLGFAVSWIVEIIVCNFYMVLLYIHTLYIYIYIYMCVLSLYIYTNYIDTYW